MLCNCYAFEPKPCNTTINAYMLLMVQKKKKTFSGCLGPKRLRHVLNTCPMYLAFFI